MNLRKNNYLVGLAIIILLCSCAVNTASYEKNIYKVLNMAATTYESTMETIGDAYKRGLIDDSAKEKIIEKANIYWKSYHSAVLAYEMYIRQKDNLSKNRLDKYVKEMDDALFEFLEISQSNLSQESTNGTGN